MKRSLLIFSLFFSFSVFSQNVAPAPISTNNAFDEATLREKMKNDGLSQAVIEKLIAQRKELFKRGKNVEWISVKKQPATNAICSDMSVENGWSAWLGDLGTVATGPVLTWTPPAATPAAPSFTITAGAGTDPNSGGATNPTIPHVCPGMGNHSIKIGEDCVAGCVAEQLTYPISVTPQDTDLIVAFAIVIQDAGHAVADAPFVDFCIYDAGGNPIADTNACFRYVGAPNIPGAFPVSGTGCAFVADYYVPWTIVTLDLAPYIGQTISVVITNVDCAQCGHWSYSYWDFSCGASSMFLNTSSTPDTCLSGDGTATVNVSGGTPPFAYAWSNGQTTQTATGLAAGTYTVTVTDSASLVNSTTVVVNNTITAVTSSVIPVNCFGGSTGSAQATITGAISPVTFLWSNGQTTQTATGLSAGTYSVLITDATGCTATAIALVPGAPMLITNANNTPSSCWNCPDGSAGTNVIGGTAPYTYYWTPGGQTTPNIVGLVPGMYAVCVTDSKGCMKCDTLWVVYLGVNEILDASVSVSPNPSAGIFSIDFGTKSFGNTNISICDMLGKTLFETLVTGSGKQSLDISGIQRGIYFLHLKTETGIATKKIVISK